MEIRNLKTFLQAADMCNFTRTADALGYSQSNVTAQIQQLERELGLLLFDRLGKTVSLTAYGQEFLPYAREVVAAATRAESFPQRSGQSGGVLRVGVVESIFDACFCQLLPLYRHTCPNVRLTLSVDTAAALREKIRCSELDVIYIIDHLVLDSDWVRACAHEEPIVLLANPQNRLAGHKKLTADALLSESLITMEQGASYQIEFNEMLSRLGMAIKPVLELPSASMAVRLAEQNDCITVVPLYAAQASIAAGATVILDVDGLNMTKWRQLLYHKNKVLTPPLEAFLRIAGTDL